MSPGDTFARPCQLALMPGFTTQKLSPRKPGQRLVDLKQESGIPFMRGFTDNHKLQALAGWYCLTGGQDREVRDTLLYFLGPHYDTRGYEGGEFLASSHHGHFLAAYGPIAYCSARAGDEEMFNLVARVLKRLLSAISIMSYYNRKGNLRIVAPCSRCHLAPQEKADQREEMNYTFQWLHSFVSPDRMPKWMGDALFNGIRSKTQEVILNQDALQVPPSVLGFYALMKGDAEQVGSPDFWSRLTKEMDCVVPGQGFPLLKYLLDLPPLKYPLVVYRSPQGHAAEYLNTKGMRNVAQWAWADYQSGTERYGYPAGKEPMPRCPGNADEIVKYEFPLAGQRK